MSAAHEQLKEILAEAAAKTSAAERAAYLDAACRGEPALRAQVEALLAAHDRAGAFLEQTVELVTPDFQVERPGTRIGRYKLLEQIGEGGFGVVFMAEQTEPVNWKVALKIIKAGMDTREVIARFAAERQALALMDHPNIAKIFDAGVTEGRARHSGRAAVEQPESGAQGTDAPYLSPGRPYFVMELVKGIAITNYCDEFNLTTDERLQLFMQVCRAVQHAHQKGIIHRDLKPTNILVTVLDGKPVPKIIDFGVAKALGQRLTERTLFTAFAQMVGTPAYMSPEQAALSSVDVDTRSDIYSLGVLLYELLTGVTPFATETLHQAALEEVRRLIREVEPPKPSTRLRTLGAKLTEVAQHRQTEPAALTRLVHGDLDWIVMKALEKERGRRYETANSLVEDLQHHLHHEPVKAGPPGTLYRTRKFVRRHQMGVALAGSVTVALVAGLIASLIGFQEARLERDHALEAEQAAQQERDRAVVAEQRAEANEKEAQTEASRSAQVARFMKDMLKGVEPAVALGRDTTMLREILDQTVKRISRDLNRQPQVEAELRNTVGEVYQALGQYHEAEATHRVALALRMELLGEQHLDVAQSLYNLGNALQAQSRLTEAETAHREALTIRQTLLGREHEEVVYSLIRLANVLRFQQKRAEAEILSHRALAMAGRLFSSDHPLVAEALNNFANVLHWYGNTAEAEQLYREAFAMQTRLLGSDHPEVATSLNNLAYVLRSQRRLVEAESLFREALAINTRILGSRHPGVAGCLRAVADTQSQQGKLADAELNYREALAIREQTVPDSWWTFEDRRALGAILLDQKRYAEAEPLLNSAYAGLKERQDTIPHNYKGRVGQAILSLMELCEATDRPEEAAEWKEKLADFRQGYIPETWVMHYGQQDEAERQYRQALAMNREWLGDRHPTVAVSLADLAIVLHDQGKLNEAEALYVEAMAMTREFLHGEHPDVLRSLNNLISWFLLQGQPAEAAALCREALAASRNSLGHEHPRVFALLETLGDLLWRDRKLSEAQEVYSELLSIQRQGMQPTDLAVRQTLSNMAALACSMGRWQEGLDLCQALIAASHNDLGVECLAGVTALLAGQPETWRQQCLRMLSLYGQPTKSVFEQVPTVRTCILAPEPGLDPSRVLELAESALVLLPENQWCQLAVGGALYRAGKPQAAIQHLQALLLDACPAEVACPAGYLAALAYHQLNQPADARTALEQAERSFVDCLHRLVNHPQRLGACAALTAGIVLRAEAEHAILGRVVVPQVNAGNLATIATSCSIVRHLLQQAQNACRNKAWKEAAEVYARAINEPALDWFSSSDPVPDFVPWMSAAFVRAGDANGLRALCQWLVRHVSLSPNPPLAAERAARACLLMPEPSPDLLRQAGDWLALASASVTKGNFESWVYLDNGLLHYRSGRYVETIESCQKAVAGSEPHCQALGLLLQAMALQHLGQRDAAATRWRQFVASGSELVRRPNVGRMSPELLVLELLVDEASPLFSAEVELPHTYPNPSDPNRVTKDSQDANPIPVPSGLVAWWAGDGNALDLCGTNHGSLFNSATFTRNQGRNAFYFNAFDRVVAPTVGLPIGTNDRTIELWVRIDALVGREAFFAGYGGFGTYTRSFALGASAAGQLFWSSWGPAFTGPRLKTGTWHHLAVISNRGLTTLFLDGVTVAAFPALFDTPAGSLFYLGSIPETARNTADRILCGAVDEVSVYNRALSPEEIKAIFDAGSAGKIKPLQAVKEDIGWK